MLILFDQGVPEPLRRFLTGHAVYAAREKGWGTLLNGELLRAAEREGFDLLITTDQSIAYQQNLKDRRIAVLVLGTTDWRIVQRKIQEIVTAVNGMQPADYAFIEMPHR
ncbi:MAG TPA: hypothetical protein VNW97_19475 [Candidatus Saccharimonadales bacterium]|jgi:hypothetical protein|nr:hypothetical protein [Candidatus Saccharimonadales bacterium]